MQKFFLPILLLSLAIAAFELAQLAMGVWIVTPYLIGGAWVIVFGLALIAFGRRALWLLGGAPFALGPPVLIALYLAACMPKSCL